MSTFRVANGPYAGPSAPKTRMGGVPLPALNGALAPQPAGANGIPLSARKAQALDLATVERRGQGPPNNPPPKPNRMFGLQEAPTFRPTADEFKDPLRYIQMIREEAQRYGIAKIIPPDSWNPPFAIDTEVSLDFISPPRLHSSLCTLMSLLYSSESHALRKANI
jgi:[histone H3]-trimethyl-L-lysine4 demethylase